MAYNNQIGFTGGQVWTPSDTAIIPFFARGFQVGVDGDVVLGYADGTTALWSACVSGVAHPHWGFIRILATGTTATGFTVGK